MAGNYRTDENTAYRRIELTAEEARSGCTKQITVGNNLYNISVPPDSRDGDRIQVNSRSGATICVAEIVLGTNHSRDGEAPSTKKKSALLTICIIGIIAVIAASAAIFSMAGGGFGRGNSGGSGSGSDTGKKDGSGKVVTDYKSKEDGSGFYSRLQFIENVYKSAEEIDSSGHPVDVTGTGKKFAFADFDGDNVLDCLTLTYDDNLDETSWLFYTSSDDDIHIHYYSTYYLDEAGAVPVDDNSFLFYNNQMMALEGTNGEKHVIIIKYIDESLLQNHIQHSKDVQTLIYTYDENDSSPMVNRRAYDSHFNVDETTEMVLVMDGMKIELKGLIGDSESVYFEYYDYTEAGMKQAIDDYESGSLRP